MTVRDPGPEVRLSVVIAAYNAAETLGAELEALALQQAPFAWEVIVSDNGSTDATTEVAHAFAGRVPRLVIVDSSQQRGPGAARNRGAAAATGEQLAFCDADDVVSPGWVAAMGQALSSHAIVTGTSRRRQLNARPDEDQFHEWSRYVMPFFPQLPVAGAGNLGLRAELFTQLGGFDSRMRTGEDLDLCWRAQLLGHHLGHAADARVDVTNRDGLRATYRQFRSYGQGNRVLIDKFAEVIAAYADLPAWEPDQVARCEDPPAPTPARHGRVIAVRSLASRALRKIGRTRRLSDLTHLSSRLGYAVGSRWGRTEIQVERVPVPQDGPRVP
ncbi:glycosyltransferase [Demequina aestuarii]|uniref:glycosyltransferase n=1 Tax=Demequina aestuarii TaxID=327095 RepID=UPI000780EC4D|nr:glycosyltransferase family A protein [Demequina aestuarii]